MPQVCIVSSERKNASGSTSWKSIVDASRTTMPEMSRVFPSTTSRPPRMLRMIQAPLESFSGSARRTNVS